VVSKSDIVAQAMYASRTTMSNNQKDNASHLHKLINRVPACARLAILGRAIHGPHSALRAADPTRRLWLALRSNIDLLINIQHRESYVLRV
jgi:hypothetical protein